ncbi:MAG: hypothetical protein OEM39_02255 [Acidimicrobiia bacterium]|nr:hypothetical protein [Acidimicrobiia bacterium]
MALWGVIVGLLLIGRGYYSALNWKTGEENWTLGAQVVIVGGIAFAGYSVVGALRPTKITFLPPAVLFVLSLAGLAVGGINELIQAL